MIASVMISVCQILVTRATGDMSQAAVNMDIDILMSFLIYITAITGLWVITAAGQAYHAGRYAANTSYHFRDHFAEYLLILPFSEFEKKGSGEILSVYANDIPRAILFVTSETLLLIRDIISVLATFLFLLLLNPLFTLLYYASFPLIAIMQVKISTPIQEKARIMSEETANFNAMVNDSLQNTSTVVAYSLEEIMENRYMAAYDRYYMANRNYIISLTKMVCSASVISSLPVFGVISAAGLSVINGNMSLAEFIAYSTLALTPIIVFMGLSEKLGSLRINMAGAVRLNESMEAAVQDIHSGEQIDETEAIIQFSNVNFSYDGEGGTLALDHVSFEIKHGERVAFVGASGSGKSTVLKLLLGLYEPQAGNITISGKNINSISKYALRAYFAYIPQDNYMFPESIGENILCANTGNIDKYKLEKACQDAGILDFILCLPNQFDMVLSESGENVSGGQRQRLAIARAFYRDTPAVLFDEATSALDPVTEGEFLKIMGSLMVGRTVLMVAHRLNTIVECNKIVVMDAGHIVGIGSHEQLLQINEVYASLYASLAEIQSINGSEES